MSLLVIIPYFDRPLSCLVEKVESYASCSIVSGIQVIEFDDGMSADDVRRHSAKVQVVHRPNDLRHRFVSEHTCDATHTLICDDDIRAEEELLAAMLSRAVENPTELVGAYGRRIDKRTLQYLPRQEHDADIILTKLMLGRRDLVDKVGQVVCERGFELGALALNAEDIVFSILWSHYVGAHHCMPPIFSRLVRDEIARLGGLCLRKNHLSERTRAVRMCIEHCESDGIQSAMKGVELVLAHPDAFGLRRMAPLVSATHHKAATFRPPTFRQHRIDRRRRRHDIGGLPLNAANPSGMSWCSAYWRKRYLQGGDAGERAYGRSAEMRGRFISTHMRRFGCHRLLDVGCGDTEQVSHINGFDYTGCDVAEVVIERNAGRFGEARRFRVANVVEHDVRCDSILIMDVLHCLIDQATYENMINSAFTHPRAELVVVVSKSKNYNPVRHIQYRDFVAFVRQEHADWCLVDCTSPSVMRDELYTFARTGSVATRTSIRTMVDKRSARLVASAFLRFLTRVRASGAKRGLIEGDVLRRLKSIGVVEWPVAPKDDWQDRKTRTEHLVTRLLDCSDRPAVADVCGKDMEGLSHRHGWAYDVVDLGSLREMRGSFDLLNVSFVLQNAADIAGLLLQLKEASRRYVVVGTDISSADYPISWHRRNWERCPGGSFRSDLEWRSLFALTGFRIDAIYCVRRDDDADDRYYRLVYVLDARTVA